jgi:hypothetical protein
MANPILRQLLGETETAPKMEPWQQNALDAIHSRFVKEREAGFTTDTGQQFSPIPHAEAEARWQKVESKFIGAILNADPDTIAHLKRDYAYKSGVSGTSRSTNVTYSHRSTCPHCGGAL